MVPIFQTRFGQPYGNCLAACTASILGVDINEVDPDPTVYDKLDHIICGIESKYACKFYKVDRRALIDQKIKLSITVDYCIALVCASTVTFGKTRVLVWHAIVCRLLPNFNLEFIFNPDPYDHRKHFDDYRCLDNCVYIVCHSKNETLPHP